MKTKAILLIAIGVIFAIARGIGHYYAYIDYKNNVESYWDLSERAATIAQKSEYMDKFVSALSDQHLSGTNANLFIKTPESDFDENFKALKSLQKRLKDISKMNESDFAYQTAIQQITQQEQGEANGMISNLACCWKKVNYYTFYNIILIFIFLIIQLYLIIYGTYLWLNIY